MNDNKEYAKDFECQNCPNQAEVFVGLADPDATKIPVCKECADQWRIEVILALLDIRDDYNEVD